MSTERTEPDLGRVAACLFELFVLAPLGAGARLVVDGTSTVAKARQELNHARFVGKRVVQQGAAQLKAQLADAATSERTARAATSNDRADASNVTGDSSSGRRATVPTPTEEPVHTDVDHEPRGADDLALPDYDQLPAIDVVAQLVTLSTEERADIERYERANRRRRTVLGKLEQLADPS